jgi:hypothetical protein
MTTPPFTPPPAGDPTQPVFAQPESLYGGPVTTAPVPTGPVTTVAPPPRKGGSSRLLNGLLALALVVAVGGVAFAVGRATAPAAAASTGRFGNGNGGFVGNGNFPQGSFTPGQGNFRGGGGVFGAGGALTIAGTVTRIDASGVTIKTANGDEITVSTDGSTTYHAATSGTASDVTVGATVDVKVSGFGGRGAGGGNGGNGGNGAPPPSLGTGNTGGNAGNGGASTTPTISATDITVQK